MRRNTRTVVLLLVMTLVIAAAPAASGASHGLKTTFEADGTLFYNDAPADVAARCPDGWGDLGGWIFGATPDTEKNTGTLTIADYPEGLDFTFEFDHCSRWVSVNLERPTGVQVGKTSAGEMTIATSVGELLLEYSGTWVLEGAPPDFTADLKLHYTVVGGTGYFADASGHGRLFMTVGGGSGTGLLNGSLK